MKLLEIFLLVHVSFVAGKEQGLLSLTDGELVNSHLWREEGENLFLVKQGTVGAAGGLPAELADFVVESSQHLPITAVQVLCEEEATSEVCSLLAHHQAIVKPGIGEVGVVGVDLKYEDKREYLNGILELLIGEAITRVDTHASLKSSIETNPECFVAVVLNTSSAEYTTLLSLYMTLQLSRPLILTRSKETLPLLQRPHYSKKSPPLHLYSVLGQEWYMLFTLKQTEKFLLRAQYPAIVSVTGDIDEYRKTSLHLVIIFPGLPGSDKLNLRELVETAAKKLYLSHLFIFAERKENNTLVKHYHVTDEFHLPQVVVLPNGADENSIIFEVPSNRMEMEVEGLVNMLVSFHHKSDGDAGVGGAGGGPKDQKVSITDLEGIDRLTANYDLMVGFCKKGSKDCPGEVFFILKSVEERLVESKVNISYKFFVVECNSVNDVLKYELNSLPGYTLYNKSQEVWLAGDKELREDQDILSLIADTTDHSEILDPSYGIKDFDEMVYHPHLQEERPDDDIYQLLGRTIPSPSLPSDLVLTDINFEEKLKSFEKTAVLFYLQWSVESKMVLHHLIAASERIDTSLNVSVAGLDCYSHTRVCGRFNVTALPSLLIFTPATLDTPSAPPPSISVLDSSHFLWALGQSTEDRAGLMEITPASLPLLLKSKLTTPLVLWCDSDPSSELGVVFSAAVSETNSDFSFAWINSSEHSSLLDSALALDGNSFPAVVAMQLSESAVYQMGPVYQIQPASFREHLLTFLNQLKQGKLEPIKRLSPKKWPPLYPPFHFPSVPLEFSQMVPQSDTQGGGGEFELRGELDLESIPRDDPPQVMEYPIVEDNSHEDMRGGMDEFGQNREEL